MKKTNENGENVSTHEKFFWIIGIAVIVFMVLLFGSLIGLRITENGLDNISGKGDNLGGVSSNKENYVTLEDGTKENVNENVKNASFDFNGVTISGFTIEEKEGISTVKADIRNTTNEVVKDAKFSVKLVDDNGDVIADFSIITSELEPGLNTRTVTPIMTDCTHAANVLVENRTVADTVSGE